MYKVKVKEDGRVKVPDTALAVHDHGPRICFFSDCFVYGKCICTSLPSNFSDIVLLLTKLLLGSKSWGHVRKSSPFLSLAMAFLWVRLVYRVPHARAPLLIAGKPHLSTSCTTPYPSSSGSATDLLFRNSLRQSLDCHCAIPGLPPPLVDCSRSSNSYLLCTKFEVTELDRRYCVDCSHPS